MEENTITLGSLFDGSGGFPLGGTMVGIEPRWAAEVEPFPIRVTTKRFPNMKHYGDVAKMKGGEIEPVDVITFGSPCQDLSIAGGRDGLQGNKSGLFYEAVRIVKEMREKTNGKQPKYIVWENVPGAFSSNKGEDFRAVLEAIGEITGHQINVPKPRKWRTAGLIMGNNFSIGWRVLDAQYWGVPQKRRRIYLVADFTGRTAGEILFIDKGLPGYLETCGKSWANFTGATKENIRTSSASIIDQGGQRMDFYTEQTGTLTTNHAPYVYITSKASFHTKADKDISPTLVATDSKDAPNIYQNDKVRKMTPDECRRLQGFPSGWCDELETEEPSAEDIQFWREVFETQRKIMGTSKKSKTENQIIKWLKAPKSDTAEYKMWGNGVALPNVVHVLGGIVREFKK